MELVPSLPLYRPTRDRVAWVTPVTVRNTADTALAHGRPSLLPMSTTTTTSAGTAAAIALFITVGCVPPTEESLPAPPPTGLCGDGVCELGETPVSCPQDCGPPVTGVPAPTCAPAIDLGVQVPVDRHDPATAQLVYTWRAPDAGRYQISETGGSLEIQSVDCNGTELATGSDRSTVALRFGEPVTITVTGVTGNAELQISREADVCGDGVCEAGETCGSCPTDCGACVPPSCGDGVCDAGEDCNNCPADCGECEPAPSCGDGVCDAGEDCNSCPADCGECQPPPDSCGDGVCGAGEDCSSCPEDCGSC
jgi:hypothetical protein